MHCRDDVRNVHVLAQVGAAYAVPVAAVPSHAPQATQQPKSEPLAKPIVEVPSHKQLSHSDIPGSVVVPTTVEQSRDPPGAVPNTDKYGEMSVKELRLMASSKGIDDDAIEHARDAHDPQAELVALIKDHDSRSPAPIDYSSMTVRELRQIASERGIAHDAIERARDGDDPKAELITLIMTESGPKQGP